MPEFVAPDPKAQIHGAAMGGIIAAIRQAGFDSQTLDRVLEGLGLRPLNADGWYPIQAYLDLLKISAHQLPAPGLLLIGRAVPETARFPPEIRTLDRALKTLDVAYHLNHRGGNIGGYLCEHVGDAHYRVHCDTPYGCDFDTGILESLIARFPVAHTHATLTHLFPASCRKQGGSTCVYDITWPLPQGHP